MGNATLGTESRFPRSKMDSNPPTFLTRNSNGAYFKNIDVMLKKMREGKEIYSPYSYLDHIPEFRGIKSHVASNNPTSPALDLCVLGGRLLKTSNKRQSPSAPSKECQDEAFIIEISKRKKSRSFNMHSMRKINQIQNPAPDAYVFGVFDGHGHDGQRIAKACVMYMEKLLVNWKLSLVYEPKKDETVLASRPEYVAELLEKLSSSHVHSEAYETNSEISSAEHFFKSTFEDLDAFVNDGKDFSSKRSGTTATMAIISPVHQKAFVAWAGDSKAMILVASNDTLNDMQGFFITSDHGLTTEAEVARIKSFPGGDARGRGMEKFGKGDVGPIRVWHGTEIGIPMSRSLGDTFFHEVGVIAEPEITVLDFKNLRSMNDLKASLRPDFNPPEIQNKKTKKASGYLAGGTRRMASVFINKIQSTMGRKPKGNQRRQGDSSPDASEVAPPSPKMEFPKDSHRNRKNRPSMRVINLDTGAETNGSMEESPKGNSYSLFDTMSFPDANPHPQLNNLNRSFEAISNRQSKGYSKPQLQTAALGATARSSSSHIRGQGTGQIGMTSSLLDISLGGTLGGAVPAKDQSFSSNTSSIMNGIRRIVKDVNGQPLDDNPPIMHCMLLIATDGVWTVMSKADVVLHFQLFMQGKFQKPLQDEVSQTDIMTSFSESLCIEAQKKWRSKFGKKRDSSYSDDISAVTALLF